MWQVGPTDGKLPPNIVHVHPIIARPRHKNDPLESGIQSGDFFPKPRSLPTSASGRRLDGRYQCTQDKKTGE
jgi:hypothetical protein